MASEILLQIVHLQESYRVVAAEKQAIETDIERLRAEESQYLQQSADAEVSYKQLIQFVFEFFPRPQRTTN